MENLSQLTKTELLSRAKFLAEEDKRISLLLVDILAECERRMLHLELGYASLWEFAVKYLHLSEASAQLRISAMRLAKDNPQVIESLKSGELSLTNAAQLQSFFREKKKLGEMLSSETKNTIIQSVSGLSKRECEKTLLGFSPWELPQEKERLVSENLTELKLIMNESMIEKLKRLKDMLAHQMPSATYGELLEYTVDETLERLEKKRSGVASAEFKAMENKKYKVPEIDRKAPKEPEDIKSSELLCPEKATSRVSYKAL